MIITLLRPRLMPCSFPDCARGGSGLLPQDDHEAQDLLAQPEVALERRAGLRGKLGMEEVVVAIHTLLDRIGQAPFAPTVHLHHAAAGGLDPALHFLLQGSQRGLVEVRIGDVSDFIVAQRGHLLSTGLPPPRRRAARGERKARLPEARGDGRSLPQKPRRINALVSLLSTPTASVPAGSASVV